MTNGFAATALVYGLTLWLGLYLIGHDPHVPRLLLTGMGLLAYALALACGVLVGVVPEAVGFALKRAGVTLLLLPRRCCGPAPDTTAPRGDAFVGSSFSRVWGVAALLLAIARLMASVGSGVVAGTLNSVRLVIGALVLAPMLASVGIYCVYDPQTTRVLGGEREGADHRTTSRWDAASSGWFCGASKRLPALSAWRPDTGCKA